MISFFNPCISCIVSLKLPLIKLVIFSACSLDSSWNISCIKVFHLAPSNSNLFYCSLFFETVDYVFAKKSIFRLGLYYFPVFPAFLAFPSNLPGHILFSVQKFLYIQNKFAGFNNPIVLLIVIFNMNSTSYWILT